MLPTGSFARQVSMMVREGLRSITFPSINYHSLHITFVIEKARE